MDHLVIGAVALLASGLTLVSGFGLGTLLLPAFALFFPLDVSVALTAVVHLANNLFKLGLVGRRANLDVVLRFGLPALLAALAGAFLLGKLSHLAPLASYELGGRAFQVRPLGLVLALLMAAFAALELLPSFQRLAFPSRALPLGGALSGFFGGLSGHQGALRSAFLLRFKEGVTPESFIATNVVIAVMVDVSRLAVYGRAQSWAIAPEHRAIVLTAVLSAFLGAWLGSKLVKKITMRAVQLTVGVLLVLIALLLGSGLIGSRPS